MKLLSGSTGNRHLAILLVILLCSGSFLLLTLNRPFEYDSEATGSAYGVMARNYLNYTWAETHGMPVLTMGRNPGAPIFFYRDHPPTVPLLIFGVYKAFGAGEWQTRLPSAICTVLTALALFLLLSRHGSARLGLIASAVFVALPMNLYYGGFAEVVYQPLLLFIVLSVFAYLNFHDDPSLKNLAILTGVFALAGASDWPAFVIVPVYLAHFVFTKPRAQWPRILAFCVAACGVFAALYIYIAIATHSPWDWILSPLTHRAGLRGSEVTGAVAWWTRVLGRSLSVYTLPVLLLSAAWILSLRWRSKTSAAGAETICLLLLSWACLHVAVGREGVFIHDWWLSPLAPGLAIATALALDAMAPLLNRRMGNSHVAEAVIACLLILFGGWTAKTSYKQLFAPRGASYYSSRELGHAIQLAAPGPNDLALLVWSGTSPEEFFYGNRPIQEGIWSLDDLRNNLRGEKVALVYAFEQPWNRRASGIVFPLRFQSEFAELLRYLQNNYQQVPAPGSLAGKFAVFDLQASPAGESAQ